MEDNFYTFEGFLEFCRTKKPLEKYIFTDMTNCACAQYARTRYEDDPFLKQMGRLSAIPFLHASSDSKKLVSNPMNSIWYEFNHLARDCDRFGELVIALEKAIKARTEAVVIS